MFYTRYPDVKCWHHDFAMRVDAGAVYLFSKDGVRDKSKSYTHATETGRRFVFKEYYSASTWSTRMYNFSPTELKNWPIQGLATGDIVPMMLGVLFRTFKDSTKVRLVNTIHDSVMFDVATDAVPEFILDVLEVFRKTHEHFESTFSKKLALKLNASASFGKNWYDMHEAEV